MPSSSTSPSSPSISTITPETLESDLLAHLASSTALEDLHSTLLCSLQRMGWTEKIRKLSLELLRAGRCDRFDEVVEAVVASAEGRGHALWGEDAHTNSNLEADEGGIDGGETAALRNLDVRIPSEVVEQGVRAIKEVLREVVVLEEENDSGEGMGQRQQSNGTEKDKDSSKDAKEKEKGKHSGATEKSSSKVSTKAGQDGLKNGDTSPVKKTEKKPKPGKGK
ncbi:uncharacterized protein LDX57_007068 [Aspergillus melleus]|uniref:uncharacterized protein n=1 Tax=Aspergillus melleus TaxID=138277 RepID=UPI001E8EE72F|nr:uncharacterized protein LDX57_007068 [Aspergillus melleus]KAH8429405.1 hypothetical protein LDX57_007068 [Aspergillus melleus]